MIYKPKPTRSKKYLAGVAGWHNQIAYYVRMKGPLVGGLPVQFHHPKGRTYKHNKTLIGPWWFIPIGAQYHDVGSNDPLNVTHHRKRFVEEYGKQSHLWKQMVDDMMSMGEVLPFGQEVIESIIDTGE